MLSSHLSHYYKQRKNNELEEAKENDTKSMVGNNKTEIESCYRDQLVTLENAVNDETEIKKIRDDLGQKDEASVKQSRQLKLKNA